MLLSTLVVPSQNQSVPYARRVHPGRVVRVMIPIIPQLVGALVQIYWLRMRPPLRNVICHLVS